MKTIAIIGRPNVGKSSLFNVLTKSRDAIVADFPGLTRDRHYSSIKVNHTKFLIIDTGGLEVSKKNDISRIMASQTEIAIDESEIVFFIVDGRFGRHPFDEEIARLIRKKNKQILLIINKSEGLDHNNLNYEFKSLGLQNQICISASHRDGVSLIYDFLLPFCQDPDGEKTVDDKIKIAILGKPNVGKSTLINSVIGEDRFIAFDQPGTTRDSVSTEFIYDAKSLILIDTAGIRKKGKVSETIEKFSLLKSILSIDQSDISVLVINADEGVAAQDLQIFGYIIDSGKPVVIIINKWDLLNEYDRKIFKDNLSKKIHFFNNYELLYVSALKKQGLKNIFKSIFQAYDSSRIKIKTPILNKFLSDLIVSHQPPIIKGIRPKLKYIHQGDICPPTFIIHGNHLSGLKKDYIKFIESSLIKTFRISGTPLKVLLNESNNPFDKDAEKEKRKKTGLVTRRRLINKKRNEIKKKNLN